MSQAITDVYNRLTQSAQQEVYDFMMYLVQKQEKAKKNKQDTSRKEKRLEALSQISGSMKEIWEGIDPLEYQKNMREDRSLG